MTPRLASGVFIAADGRAFFESPVIVVHEFIYVTNLAIDLRIFDDPTTPTLTNGTVDSQWAAEVKVHTISKIRAHIPRVPGLRMDDETDD